MATRTLEIDLRQGTGASSEPMYGVVTVQRAKAKSAGGFEILPFETSLKLINGKATITEAETDGTGPFYDSVYLFRVQNGYCGRRYGFMAALPDGTTPITTGELPMVDPITGEGIYMDAQEWNALYGDLPDRVSSLETGKANKAHSHVIGDVTGLQTALNTKGNATMRVDTSVGTRVFVSDGITEVAVRSSTGPRRVPDMYRNGAGSIVTGEVPTLSRDGDVVVLQFTGRSENWVSGDTFAEIPAGFRPPSTLYLPNGYAGSVMAATMNGLGALRFHVNGLVAGRWIWMWVTKDPWPTTLPGTAL